MGRPWTCRGRETKSPKADTESQDRLREDHTEEAINQKMEGKGLDSKGREPARGKRRDAYLSVMNF